MKKVLGLAACIVTAATGWGDDYGTIDHGLLGVDDTTTVRRVLQLTQNPWEDMVQCWGTWPWSADGREIVYTAQIGGGWNNSNEICVISPDGTGWRRLTYNDRCDTHASFTPDGAKIVFQRNVSNSLAHIWIMDADTGSNQVSLTLAHGGAVIAGSGENKPMVSPDGTRILFRAGEEDLNALWVMDVDGLNPVRVTPEWLGDINKHSWSPDSQWVLFNARHGGASMPTDVYKVRVDGTGLLALSPTNDLFCANWSAFSPDGTKIAFHQNNHSYESESTNEAYKLSIMNPDGSGIEDLVVITELTDTNDWGDVCGPVSWSPNSQWLQFKTHNESGDRVVCLMHIPTREVVNLTIGYDDYRAWWSPDGKYILFRDRSSDSRDNGAYDDDLLVIELANPELYARTSYILWQDARRNLVRWRMDASCNYLDMMQSSPYGKWTLAACGDLNRNGWMDTLWTYQSGDTFKARAMYDDMTAVLGPKGAATRTWTMPAWKSVAVARVNKDAFGDLVWQDEAGNGWVTVQQQDGQWATPVRIGAFAPATLAAAGSNPKLGSAAFLYFQYPAARGNDVLVYSIHPTTYQLTLVKSYKHKDPFARLQAVGDLDHDGMGDLIWHRKKTGVNDLRVWFMNTDHTVREIRMWKWIPGWTVLGAGQ